LQLSPIDQAQSSDLIQWLTSDTWPFFADKSPTKDSLIPKIEEMFSSGNENFWIVQDKKRIGLIEIYELDSHAPMFSIRLMTQYRGQGFGKVAVAMSVDYIFKQYPDKHRIEAQTREDNIAMRKVFHHCYFVKEAHYRKVYPAEGIRLLASIAYGLLREDWLGKKRTPIIWNDLGF
jgi:RimJ/RimL family protein N-acetyltransferase